VIRKPTELFLSFVGTGFDKEPAETWRQYGPLLRALFQHQPITPELLAGRAQVDSSGIGGAHYGGWQVSSNLLAVYQPASSAVGLYQMIDAAYAEAAPVPCI